MKMNPLAIWAPLDGSIAYLDERPSTGPASSRDTARFAARIEALGYGALWTPEGFGRNSLVHSSWLLANTTSLVVATGVANLYARDPMAMAAAGRGLVEQSDGRFLLGIGVSHVSMVEGTRGHDYGKPLATMRRYLSAMAEAPYAALPPPQKPVTVLAALRGGMLALAAELADGAHPFNVTPAHTAKAREILGPDKLLCVEQKLILETDPAAARAIGRKRLAGALEAENYRNLWKELGFTEDDMANGGSNRFIDGLIGWGDEAALRRRIQEHLDAGATQVCCAPIAADGGIDMRVIELLAPRPSKRIDKMEP